MGNKDFSFILGFLVLSLTGTYGEVGNVSSSQQLVVGWLRSTRQSWRDKTGADDV